MKRDRKHSSASCSKFASRSNEYPSFDLISDKRSHSVEEVLLTELDLARRQNRSVKTIRNQRVAGTGVRFLKLGRLVRYRLADAVAWENASIRVSTSDEGEQ
jgi:hypothetical protein